MGGWVLDWGHLLSIPRGWSSGQRDCSSLAAVERDGELAYVPDPTEPSFLLTRSTTAAAFRCQDISINIKHQALVDKLHFTVANAIASQTVKLRGTIHGKCRREGSVCELRAPLVLPLYLIRQSEELRMSKTSNFDVPSPFCVLCGRTDDCPEKYGEKRTYVAYNLTVHYYCLLMSSGIWQRGEEDEGVDGFLIADIKKEVNRAAKLITQGIVSEQPVTLLTPRMSSIQQSDDVLVSTDVKQELFPEEKIKYANSLPSLQSAIHDCYKFLAAAGCLRPITSLCDKEMLVNDILIHHVIKRIISPLESFRQGLKTLGVLEKMQMHPDAFSSILCHKPERLSAETVCDLFTIHSSSDVNKAEGADFWVGYLQDVESGESVVTLEDILLFATGFNSIPPIGFDPEPTIKFLHGRYPIGNRLLNCLELPITETYEQFKNKMEFTIRNTLRVKGE
ncbi:hypothetical protein llap_217 [Limosa lapponica baueri]|uniref:HECT domain-containing protein n=1 Tax=Limosa lapponica baueri TaxID=1758121 RepID=A0A2I0UU07_LIMLA|nr:hypothetical protein llap_217 [Limosa lapponica baueri]